MRILKTGLQSNSKALLLDVDGVVVKNNKLLSKVTTNITRYYAKKLHLPHKDAIKVNKVLYSEYGHSYRGLKKACGVTSTLDDFNYTVYDNDIMLELEELKKDYHHAMHSQHLRELAVACKTKEIPIYIFSNAPFNWCYKALEISGLCNYVPVDHIISCDHEVPRHFHDDGFKPIKGVYDKLHDYIDFMECDNKTLAFVEDSFKNLVPIIGQHEWVPIYYGRDVPLYNTLQMVTTNDIRQVKNVMCYSANNLQKQPSF